MISEEKKQIASEWFTQLRDQLCQSFEKIEEEFALEKGLEPGKFQYTPWEREGGGGGTMALMKGNVFEKIGVNVSTVFGTFEGPFAQSIPGTENDPHFWASGLSLVSHPKNPFLPTAHMNTRHIITQKWWFGGGADLTPFYPTEEETQAFHAALEEACAQHDPAYYPQFKKWCDEYFFLPHRNEPRGVGGIFYDNLNTENWNKDVAFTQDVGRAFAKIYPWLIREKMYTPWTQKERQHQLQRRGRYVEFNLLYDRGTLFGLKTKGNTEAILMSLPPAVTWP